MQCLQKIIALSLLFVCTVLPAQEFDLSFHKARLSKGIYSQVEDILTSGDYKPDKSETRKKIEIKVDTLLNYLHKWLKGAVQCDSTNIKECEEYWSKEEKEANEQSSRGKEDFLIAERKLWLVIMEKPSQNITPYNTWLKYYLKYEYHIEMEFPIISDASYFSMILKETMYRLRVNRFGIYSYKKQLFAISYNHIGSLMEEKAKTLESYKVKISLVDSLLTCGLKNDSSAYFREKAADVYHTLAQNFLTMSFVKLEEKKCEEAFGLAEQLFAKSLSYKSDAKAYYNFATHYYNYGVDLVNSLKETDNEKKLEKMMDFAMDSFKKSQPLFEKACGMDTKYCNYPKLPK